MGEAWVGLAELLRSQEPCCVGAGAARLQDFWWSGQLWTSLG
jgi:hypothetical protein